jgi:hypothetical protein
VIIVGGELIGLSGRAGGDSFGKAGDKRHQMEWKNAARAAARESATRKGAGGTARHSFVFDVSGVVAVVIEADARDFRRRPSNFSLRITWNIS